MLKPTKYYEEFLRYAQMSAWQHNNCNLGKIPYSDTPFNDDLIKNVYLYDVCERKYAGFTQLLLDIFYSVDNHPYAAKMNEKRRTRVESFDTTFWSLEEFLFVFFVHRLTGSGINYASLNTGYHNSVLLYFTNCNSIDEMVDIIRNFKGPKFTSIGYQIAPFPKPQGDYKLGGDYFMCEILPDLVSKLAKYLENGIKKDFRTIMSWLESYNKNKKMRVFWFQYAAVLADIADFFPRFINTKSHFFYGKNAIECLKYLAERPSGLSEIEFLDKITDKIYEDIGAVPYNSEDIACDFIRWVENYINPKGDYSHLNLDLTWSSHNLIDHPFGRQKPMLELGLIKTFNGYGHPSDDKILKDNGLTIESYRDMVKTFYK